ncbi:MAG: 1-acyl-sn-glycerol-3-phosphate acyltransferase [Ruminococcus sp.]|nr:1-acyl-sn-glycerol-3-phosphate acyltransferase [Ruminococcus sp.]
MNEKEKTQPKPPKAPLFSFKYFPTDFLRVTGALPLIVWLRPRWIYENENAKKKIRGPALVIANHSTFYDPVYISLAMWYRRNRFIIKKEIYDSKAHPLFKAGRCIPIDPENASLDAVKAATAALKQGEVIDMFPEGHVTHTKTDIEQFKSGVVLMALRGKAPILPIYIRNMRSAFDRILFAVGEPIDLIKEYGCMPTFAQIEEVSDKLFRKMQQLEKLAEEYQ